MRGGRKVFLHFKKNDLQMEENKQVRTFHLEELRFDLSEAELRGHLSRFRPGGCPCAICGKDNWAIHLFQFPDGGTRALPDSITLKEYLGAQDAGDRGVKCAAGNYIFICASCGFSMSFNSAVAAARIFVNSEKK